MTGGLENYTYGESSSVSSVNFKSNQGKFSSVTVGYENCNKGGYSSVTSE